jgi:hypothetical protein
MKHMVFGSLSLLPLLLSPMLGAARAETIWVGQAFIVAKQESTPGICGDAASIGDYSKIVYRPASAPLGNGADSYLSYVGRRTSLVLFVPNNTFRSGINYSGTYVSSQLNFGTKVGGVTAWSLTPTVLAADTLTATLTATFANFFGVTGCTVSWRADLERVP